MTNKTNNSLYIFKGINKIKNIENFITANTFIENKNECIIVNSNDNSINIGTELSINEQFLVIYSKNSDELSEITEFLEGYNGAIIIRKEYNGEFVISNSITVLNKDTILSDNMSLQNALDTL